MAASSSVLFCFSGWGEGGGGGGCKLCCKCLLFSRCGFFFFFWGWGGGGGGGRCKLSANVFLFQQFDLFYMNFVFVTLHALSAFPIFSKFEVKNYL
jgi:hypothetical protein